MGSSCQNLPDADPICSYIQGWLSRNLGMAGEHCNIPNNPVMTGQIQTACPKTCCQCQGKLRCEHYIDLFGGPQMGSSRKDPRPAGGRSGDAGLLNPQPLKCNNSNSTLAVRSGFDLHRFLKEVDLKILKISSRSHGVVINSTDF